MGATTSRTGEIAGHIGGRAATVARAAYYATGFTLRFPGKDVLEKRLHRWEGSAGRGDVPQDRARWDEQYSRGRWAFLSGLQELAHYAVIVGYAEFLRPQPSVLDVGCGAGVLHERFRSVGYARYTGVDISEVAVSSLQDSAPADAHFVAADAATYTPPGTYDVIVFNESITYFTDPGVVFERYLRFLSPGGVAIVSCHVQSARAQAILRVLKRDHVVVDETVVRQGKVSWRIVVFSGQG